MNSTFDHDLVKDHGDALRREADHARLVRAARGARNSHRPGFARSRRVIVIGAIAASAAAGATYSTAKASPPSHRPTTPNECIAVNGGDYNACNVGNNGRGDLPYRTDSSRPPTQCLRHKYGDDSLCNAGTRGRLTAPDRSTTF